MGAGAPGAGRAGGRRDRDDLRFHVAQLRRHPGAREEEVRELLPAGLLGPDGDPGELRIADVSVAPEPVLVEVTLEATNDAVRVIGSVEFTWEGPCRRCLARSSGRCSAALRELFVDDPERFAGSEDDADSLPREITDGWVDLGEAVRETVLLGLPLAPLCGEACEGPDPEQFPVSREDDERAAGPGDPEGPAARPDPRWAALSELRFDQGDT